MARETKKNFLALPVNAHSCSSAWHCQCKRMDTFQHRYHYRSCNQWSDHTNI